MPEAIPTPLTAVPTGVELCARTAALDPHCVTDDELPALLAAEARQMAYQQARLWSVMAEMARRDPTPNLPPGTRWTAAEIFDSAVNEVRAELRLTLRAAGREVAQAASVFALPRIAEALKTGAIDRVRAIVLADGCFDLTDQQTTKVLNELLPDAALVTATRLAEKVQKLAIALDPSWAERRYRQAVHDRRVVGYLNADGTATVSGQYLPADEAAAALQRVINLAANAKAAGAAAKIDQLRTEIFLGLLGGHFDTMTEAEIVAELQRQFPKSTPAANDNPPAPAPTPEPTPGPAPTTGVELRVRLGTLMGRDDEPAELPGWGSVPASVARKIAARQHRVQWRFAVVDAEGQLLFDGITRRRPRVTSATRQQVAGGVVELHVPLTLITDAEVAAQHPEWAGVLTDLAKQYTEQRPIEQDASARFAGRPLRRRVQVTHQRCVFAGCRRPASECDLDHGHDHARGGRTVEENLGPGCRHDHDLKTKRGWRLIRRDDVTFVWISPLGRRHVVRAEPIAAPLPRPIPRNMASEREQPDDPDPPPN